ncbi:MAG: YfcE family phosphodiesterase [Clostridia bacterium]
MRILVFSDSHGTFNKMKKAIEEQTESKDIIFCGDGEREIDRAKELFPDKNFYCVRGNNDYVLNFPYTSIIELENKKIMFTHGHGYGVKSSLDDLIFSAKSNNVDIVIFGHTHIAHRDYIDGLHILNPGSCGYFYSSFATIDIINTQIVTNIIML